MIFIGFIVSVGLLLPAAWFVIGMYKRIKTKRLSRYGVTARAVLLSVEPTGMYIDTFPEVQLQMQVFSKTGRNFVTEVCEVIPPDELSDLQVGKVMEIKYNPSNVREVVLMKL